MDDRENRSCHGLITGLEVAKPIQRPGTSVAIMADGWFLPAVWLAGDERHRLARGDLATILTRLL